MTTKDRILQELSQKRGEYIGVRNLDYTGDTLGTAYRLFSIHGVPRHSVYGDYQYAIPR